MRIILHKTPCMIENAVYQINDQKSTEMWESVKTTDNVKNRLNIRKILCNLPHHHPKKITYQSIDTCVRVWTAWPAIKQGGQKKNMSLMCFISGGQYSINCYLKTQIVHWQLVMTILWWRFKFCCTINRIPLTHPWEVYFRHYLLSNLNG